MVKVSMLDLSEFRGGDPEDVLELCTFKLTFKLILPLETHLQIKWNYIKLAKVLLHDCSLQIWNRQF